MKGMPTSPPNSAQRFLSAYNSIDRCMRTHLDCGDGRPFGELIRDIESGGHIQRKDANYLKMIAKLRNAICHSDYLNGTPVAEPREDIVLLTEKLRDKLAEKPPKVRDRMARNPHIFPIEAPVLDVLSFMAQHDFSQVVIRRPKQYELLTSNDITMWVGQQAEECGLVELDGVPLEEISSQHKPVFVKADDEIYHAQELLQKQLKTGRPVFALLVTHNGKPHETPLGLVTPWDVMSVAE